MDIFGYSSFIPGSYIFNRQSNFVVTNDWAASEGTSGVSSYLYTTPLVFLDGFSFFFSPPSLLRIRLITVTIDVVVPIETNLCYTL